MQIDRNMVSLFFEIKRSLPSDERNSLKISSPTIGQQLVKIHYSTGDNRLKDLIERFLEFAGEDWTRRIRPLRKSITKDYAYKRKVGEQIINHN